MKFIKLFEEIGIHDISSVGGKNASLGEMIRYLIPQGVNVPDGFATTAEAYFYVLEKTEIKEKIKSVVIKEFGGVDYLPNNLDELSKHESHELKK